MSQHTVIIHDWTPGEKNNTTPLIIIPRESIGSIETIYCFEDPSIFYRDILQEYKKSGKYTPLELRYHESGDVSSLFCDNLPVVDSATIISK